MHSFVSPQRRPTSVPRTIAAAALSCLPASALAAPQYTSSCRVDGYEVVGQVQNHGLGGVSLGGVHRLHIYYPNSLGPVTHNVVIQAWIPGSTVQEVIRMYIGPGVQSCVLELAPAAW